MTRDEFLDCTQIELDSLVEAWERRHKRDQRWQAWLMANLCTLIGNCFRDKSSKAVTFQVEDFLPDDKPQAQQREPQTPDQLKFLARALAAGGWGTITQGNN